MLVAPGIRIVRGRRCAWSRAQNDDGDGPPLVHYSERLLGPQLWPLEIGPIELTDAIRVAGRVATVVVVKVPGTCGVQLLANRFRDLLPVSSALQFT